MTNPIPRLMGCLVNAGRKEGGEKRNIRMEKKLIEEVDWQLNAWVWAKDEATLRLNL